MFALLNKLKPRVQVLRQNKKGLISVRWWFANFDYVSGNEGFKFVQFGKKKVKWFMILPRDVKCPLFLNGVGWKVNVNRKFFKLGTTRKPINFRNMWRLEDEQHNGQNRRERPVRLEGTKPLRLGLERRLWDVWDNVR